MQKAKQARKQERQKFNGAGMVVKVTNCELKSKVKDKNSQRCV